MQAILTRPVSDLYFDNLVRGGLHPVLARVFAARGVSTRKQLAYELSGLHPITELKNATEMARLLADAIDQHRRILIIADYDADGATACAVGVRALRAFGADVGYLVPNRFQYGYGLSPEIVRLAFNQHEPDILITVDNGISSHEGVAEANRLGMSVLITDHHLPGTTLPQAACTVNPNQQGCDFPSKNLAGVGVMLYVIMALRAELRSRGAFGRSDARAEPNLANLLDLVALGTVADVVKLDDNNRILVRQGLKRICAGRACAGIRALYSVFGRDLSKASTYDLAFLLGPRLNAAGRLSDMSLGIECLITEDTSRALQIAQELDALNHARREIEAEMQEAALLALERVEAKDGYSLCLYEPSWHQGVIGILAARIKDKFHRPVIAFARTDDGHLKGSGRCIPGMHLRDALDLISKSYPHLLSKFGGHAAAAGLTIREQDLEKFAAAFEAISRSLLTPVDLERVIETDGSLTAEYLVPEVALLLQDEAWGQGFPEPCFHDEFEVAAQRLVGEKHLKLRLSKEDRTFDAIAFSQTEPLPARVCAVYRLSMDEYGGSTGLQLKIDHWQAILAP